MDRIHCPKCDSLDIFRSHRRWWEKLLALINVFPFICDSCGHRFYAKWFHHPPAGEGLD